MIDPYRTAPGPGFADSCADFLHGDLDVLRVLLDRRGDGTRPGTRTDGHRVALVISGGGMRGAYSGGMAHVLEEAGLGTAFDEAYGSSVGAFVAAGLLTGQAWGTAEVFAEEMTRREFIDLRRLGSRRPVMALDHLIDHILGVARPMDWTALLDLPAPLRVIATAADDLRPHVLGELHTVADWKLAMRATATIPLLAGPPTELGGRLWLDGSVGEPVAVARALRAGATHVLVLLSRPYRERLPGQRSPLWARSLDQMVPGLGSMARGVWHYHQALSVVADAAHPQRGGARLLAITPPAPADISGLTTDPALIRAATARGRAAAQAALRAVGE